LQDSTPIIIKKKKVHGHGHHGGAWKVAYADFVTAMMAFFLVMWILGMSQETREVIQGYFRDPIGFSKNPPKTSVNIGPTNQAMTSPSVLKEVEAAKQQESVEMAQMQEKVDAALHSDEELAKLEEAGAVETRIVPEGLQIELAENEVNSELFFALGRAEVRPQARRVLAAVAPVLAGFDRPLVIDGHTDARPLPGEMDNLELSTDRANSVRRLLRHGGVPEAQLLMVRGFGARKPRRPEDPYHFSNRRVSILIPTKVVEESIQGLPEDVVRESIEGVFRLPTDVRAGQRTDRR
jgi:chemotaxis protein MotB